MTYIKRHAEKTVQELAASYGVVLVTGARQVGKTTMLSTLLAHNPQVKKISLDDASLFQAAGTEPAAFFDYNKPPIFVDEIQYAPGLFREIKRIIDARQAAGLFYLSGSQQFHLMKNVTESLAGRIGIVSLAGLSLREIWGIDDTRPFLPADFLDNRKIADIEPDLIWRIIWRGSMPMLYAHPELAWERFWGAYVRTYIERDVRSLSQVGDELKFQRFMTALAARTGTLLNLSQAAGDAGISNNTAERWLSILRASGLVFRLQPFAANAAKRMVKTPKLYFMDTGLAAYLTSWSSAEVLRDGAVAGHFFETFVITEILKSYLNQGILDPPLFFYRDKDSKEIDLLILKDGVLYPIEIKKTALPSPTDISAFTVLDRIAGFRRGPGGVVCLCRSLLPLKGQDMMFPVSLI
jgi:predicted AAA+ superfamily ATPase